jgi:ferritin-like metal-binding protein YciE
MTPKTIRDLFIEELRDTYSSETQTAANLEKMIEAATSPQLKQLFKTHQQESRQHLDRLKQAFQMLKSSPEGNFCEATEGLVKEAQEVMGEGMSGELLDVALVMAAQKVEHYEIASYGSLHAVALSCGLNDVAKLLEQTLAEEKTTDGKLTQIAETEINKIAASKAKAA